MVPGLLDPRRQFFEEGGGVAPGIDSGEDKGPAMLRAEELVITPELTEELMNVDPGLPQPGLITALQKLAQQPLEFGKEEGELVAGHGGSVGQSDPLGPLEPGVGIAQFLSDFFNDPEGVAVLRERFPDDPRFAKTSFPAGPDPANFVPSQVELPDELLGDTSFDLDLGSGPVPGPPSRLPSFSESVGEAGERKFTLVGGSPGTGRVGAAGIRAGLDPSKGPVSVGEGLFSGATQVGPGTSGSAVITDPETGLPMDFRGQQMSRLERAQRIADLTRSAISTDPIGGPEKQSRMLRALEIANREVDSSMNEIIQRQQIAIQGKQLKNAEIVAKGQLNESIAKTLAAEAQKITAEGALAKQVLEAQANNPVLTQALNALEVLAKNPDANDDVVDQIFAVLQFQLQQHGIELSEAGLLDFFGPDFTIARSTPEQGIPTQVPNGRQGFVDGGIVQPDGEAGEVAVVNDGNQELQALMSRAKAGMSAEDFQHIMEIM